MSYRRKKRISPMPVHEPASRMNGHANGLPAPEPLATGGDRPIRAAVLSFLFNWPSTGGGIVHTVELADFLGRAGYAVRHIYARHLAWGIGRVEQSVPFESLPLDFDETTFHAAAIQDRYREAVREFDPDYVIITDSWNFKPLLAEAVREFPYFLRLQASECLCPLNNLRFLPTGEQCGHHQLAGAARCRDCVERWAPNSGGLHQAEPALAGFGTPHYDETLRQAFAQAEAVLVVNELAAAMVGPYARAVKVVTSGFDPARFPWHVHRRPPERRKGAKLQLFMAGVIEDGIKGFHVLDAACQRLWRTRRDFELVATGDPPGPVNDYTRYVGWLSQDQLPAQLHQADIVVVPTIAQDALGRTAVEAMAAGRPVVASRLGGLPFTVADGAGLLFEPGNPDDLAAKLRVLLDDARLRRTMGALGRRRFEEHFTWQAIIDKHYRPLLANRRWRPTPASAPGDATPAIVSSSGRVDQASLEAPAHHQTNGKPQATRRIALIFDDERRPETTGVYCRRALEKLAEVELFRPSQLASIPRGKFDLFLNIDDGLRYRLPDDLRPSAWWCIDTHIDYAWSLEKARDFDLVFAAQRDGAERLKKDGIASVHWLPLACDPEIHGRVEGTGYRAQGTVGDGEKERRREGETQRWREGETERQREGEKRFDVCFVGNLFPGPRTELVRLIQQYFKNSYVGQAYFEEMACIYRDSRIVFNRSVANDINMRVFEALASGSLLLTNDLADNGQHELFRDGVHLATYRDGHDLLDKLRFYLRRDDVREKIAAAGREEVLAKHTYLDRMKELLHTVESGQGAVDSGQRKATQDKAEGKTQKAEKSGWWKVDSGQLAAGQIQNPTQDPAYYNFVRPELLALIPQSARRVLDIGCGAGRLGEALKARQACEVTGIELNPCAAEAARPRLDRVVMGDIESPDVDFQPAAFDCIVCGDVLEHLRSPERVLRRIHEWLAPQGCLVASVPNVAHRSVLAHLLRGDWDYEPAGLLDATHLRFFTRRSLEKLFYRSHFDVEWVGMVGGEGCDEWERAGRPGEVDIGPLHLHGLSSRQAEEMHAYQYLLVARPTPARDYGLTSIVMLTHNQWAYTARCLESIRFFTDEPYELIVVDNGSTDGTPERLRDMPDVKLIANAQNRGFPAGVNQGIAVAGGRQVLLLNNDVVVTTGWLRRMLEACEGIENRAEGTENPKSEIENPKSVALVGPLTNCASGFQQVDIPYTHLDELDGFAWEHAKTCRAQVKEVDRLVGFCLLIRREVIDEIGLFDERFGVGNFEDDDYCRRAREAGWRLVVAQDAFIHHFGHRSFDAAGVDLNALLDRNQRLYDEKWTEGTGNRAQGIDNRKSPADCSLSPVPCSLSLCMIVRDNERTIRACLESIRPWVDEMIVVDTGSTDATPDICRELGAHVYHFPWPDSFSIARNESLKHARGEWIFWMDSDDVIDAANGRKLRELVGRAFQPDARQAGKPDLPILGYVMQVHCPTIDKDGHQGMTVVDHLKLFRNLPEIQFEGRIHEQVIPSIRQAAGDVAWTDIFVVHSGADQTPDGKQRKLERDLHLLDLDLRERADHPFVHFNLGMTYADADRHEEAVSALMRSLELSDPRESQVRKTFALLVGSLAKLGRFDEARDRCAEGLRHYPQDAELLFRSAMLAHHFGRLADAERRYLAVLADREERHFTSIDRGIVSYKARHNLAVIYNEMGEPLKAIEQWSSATEEAPDYRDAWRGLGELLLQRNDVDALEQMLDRLQAQPALRGLYLAWLARCQKAKRARGAARETLREALVNFSNDADVLRAWAQELFETGQLAQAEMPLRDLLRIDPGDAAALHNLGSLLMRTHRYTEAGAAYQESVRIRPQSVTTHVHLAQALAALGRLSDAASAVGEALRLDPTDPHALATMSKLKQRTGQSPMAPLAHPPCADALAAETVGAASP